MKKNLGFTLIELLITISIITILSVIGLSMYGTVYKSSRDAKRKSDIKFIQSALEDYHADQIYYPTGGLTFGSALTNCTGTYPACSKPTKTYITNLPTDPSTVPQYSYVATPSGCDNNISGTGVCTGYCIYAKMEMPIPITDSDVGCGRDGIFPAGGYNYGITRP